MATILFYAPFKFRSRDTESLMLAFRKQGHRVIFLNQCEEGVIDATLRSNDIEVHNSRSYDASPSWIRYIRRLYDFVRLVDQHGVNVVYSHLEPANFIASIAQYFVSARVLICRHHVDEARLYGFDRTLSYRLTYWLAKTVIVVSERARSYMINEEGINGAKIKQINLAYDFDLYQSINDSNVDRIRREFGAEVLLVAACRLTRYKRPELLLTVVRRLTELNIDVKLVVLGAGELRADLEEIAVRDGIRERVFMPGYVDNVLDYLAAADFVLHPSILESSCVVIKEAGLARSAVIVCSGVGDFDEYINEGINGFLVDKENFAEEAVRVIVANFKDSKRLNALGSALEQSVKSRFSVYQLLGQYDRYNQQ